MGYAVWLFPNRDTPLNSESVRIVFSVKSGGKTIAPLNYAAKVLLFIDMYKFFVKKKRQRLFVRYRFLVSPERLELSTH